MASIFGHAAASATLYKVFPGIKKNGWILFFAVLCSILPDADVIMFRFGFRYEHWLGHRGFFHSILFCTTIGFLISFLFFPKNNRKLMLGSLFSISGISHGLLDALTSGGRGIAFFAPFDNSRYFFPWRPILVSPLGIDRFFSNWGLRVLLSEVVYIGIPCLTIYFLHYIFKSFRK